MVRPALTARLAGLHGSGSIRTGGARFTYCGSDEEVADLRRAHERGTIVQFVGPVEGEDGRLERRRRAVRIAALERARDGDADCFDCTLEPL